MKSDETLSGNTSFLPYFLSFCLPFFLSSLLPSIPLSILLTSYISFYLSSYLLTDFYLSFLLFSIYLPYFLTVYLFWSLLYLTITWDMRISYVYVCVFECDALLWYLQLALFPPLIITTWPSLSPHPPHTHTHLYNRHIHVLWHFRLDFSLWINGPWNPGVRRTCTEQVSDVS